MPRKLPAAGQFLRDLMEKHHFSRREVARRSGLKEYEVSRIGNGHRHPTKRQVVALAAAFEQEHPGGLFGKVAYEEGYISRAAAERSGII